MRTPIPSPELLNIVVDSAPIRIFWKDRDSRYLGCNALFAGDAGAASPAEIVGKTDFDLVWRAQAEAYRADDRRVMDSGEPRMDFVEPQDTPDGRRIILRTSKVPLRDRHGAVVGILGIYADDTARAAFEARLRHSEDRFRGLMEQSPLATQVLAPDGTTRAVNAAWEQLWGVPFEALANYNIRNDAQLLALGYGEAIERAFAGQASVFPITEYDRAATPQVASTGGKVQIRTLLYPVRSPDGTVREVVALHEDLTERVRMERALEASREQFRLLFERSPDANWMMDADGRFILANIAAARLLGYDRPEELVPLHPWDVSPPTQPDGRPSAEKAAEMIALANARGVHRFDWVHQRRDGSCVNVEVTLAPLSVDGHARVHCIGRDITDRVQAEARLRGSRDFLSKIVTHASEGVSVCAECAEFPFVRFSVWNDRMTEITGYTMEEINRLGWYQSMYPDPEVQARAVARMGRMRHGENLESEPWEVTTKDGERRTLAISTSLVVQEDGTPAVVGLMRDMTAERLAIEALHKSEEKYRGIFDESVAAIYVLDANLRFIDSNQAGLDLLGFSRDELLGMRTADVDAEPVAVAPAHAQLHAGGKLVNFEHRLRRKDGRVITVLNNSRPLTDVDGTLVGMQSTIFDVTELRAAEEEGERLRAQLAATQRLESIGRLAGGVAHDFNNMLGVILGRTSMALDALPSDSAVRGDLREVKDAAQRSADLARQLLAFARRQTARPVEVDLNEKVESVLKMLGRLIGEHISLRWSPYEGAVRVRIDPSQLDQVLTNLCVNARDAISSAGHIWISTSRQTLPDPAWAEARGLPREVVSLSVRDDGCGMTAEVLQNIFEPFYTTKGVGEGSGLGLATVYGIVKQNGGHIEVSSRPGAGTTFRILLPAQRTSTGPLATRTAAAPPKGTESILLVEDEPAVLRMTQRMLERAGYRVRGVPTPREALALIAGGETDFDLLVTDVIMPGMNGRDLSQRLAERIPDLKVLFISGYTADAIADHGVLADGLHLVQKPFSSEILTARVRAALRGEPPEAPRSP